MSRPGMRSSIVAMLLATALAAAGCAAPSHNPAAAGEAAPADGMPIAGVATIRISAGTLAGLAHSASKRGHQGTGGPRTYLLQNTDFRATELRLKVTGPGIASPVTVTTPWDSRGPLVVSSSANPALPSTEWTVSVPAGSNRVFTLEGIDRAGHVLASVKGVASLEAGKTATVRFDYLESAIARVLESLMAPQAADLADTAGVAATLGATDLTTPLRTFIIARTGYVRASNQFATFDPRGFRSRLLANHLRQSGVPYLANPSFDAALSTGVSYTVTLTVPARPGSESAWLYFGGAVDPERVTFETGQTSTTIAGITPGVYDVMTELDAPLPHHSWSTITVEETAAAQSFPFTLPTLSVAGPDLAPVPVPMTADSGGFVGVTDLARDPRNGSLYGVNFSYLYRLDPNAGGYHQPAGSVIHTKNLTAVTVDADGDVFVLTEDGELMKLDAPNNQLVLIAGGAANNNFADGVGAAAHLGGNGRLVSPTPGLVYLTDQDASSFRRITFDKQAVGGPVGTVKTLAGFPAGVAGNRAGCRDGRGMDARFEAPAGLARGTDGSFYITEPNGYAVRKVVLDTAADVGVVSTVAGNHRGYADGTGAQAEFTILGRNLAIDGSNRLYVAQTSPNAIRRIDPATRQVTTVHGGASGSALTNPQVVLVEQDGNLLVTDPVYTLRRLNVAGQ